MELKAKQIEADELGLEYGLCTFDFDVDSAWMGLTLSHTELWRRRRVARFKTTTRRRAGSAFYAEPERQSEPPVEHRFGGYGGNVCSVVYPGEEVNSYFLQRWP